MTHEEMVEALKTALARAEKAEPKLQAASEAWLAIRPKVGASNFKVGAADFEDSLDALDAALDPEVRDPIGELIILDPEATIDALLVAMSRAECAEQKLHVASLAWMAIRPLPVTRLAMGWTPKLKNSLTTLDTALSRTEVTP